NIFVIVRADDIGSSHAANLACIQSYSDGICRSVEVMVPCAWFLEAAAMLREHPGYDVGVHLTTTAEWSKVKWRPLTYAPSLVDSNGYFFPKQKNWSDPAAIDAFWNPRTDLVQVEAELRAQINMAIAHIPQVSHLSAHMGIDSVDPRVQELVDRLAEEYGLDIDPAKLGAKYVHWDSPAADDAETRIAKLVAALEGLTPGLYLIVEHPGLDTPEMQGHGHPGYENVAAHRDGVTKAFTSASVKAVIERKEIRLISYREAEQLFGK
ncbi:MAG: ChbG/HpnK family deacetylase, partial [Calditrichaeota bacterium]